MKDVLQKGRQNLGSLFYNVAAAVMFNSRAAVSQKLSTIARLLDLRDNLASLNCLLKSRANCKRQIRIVS